MNLPQILLQHDLKTPQGLENAVRSLYDYLNLLRNGFDNSVTDALMKVGLSASYVTQSGAAYNMTVNDFGIYHTTGAVNRVLTLVSATYPGKLVFCKKMDAGAGQVVVTPQAGETVQGAATYNLVLQYNYTLMQADGVSNWVALING